MSDNDPPDPFPPFGPFTPDCTPIERARWLGLLEMATHNLCGGSCPAAEALKRAQSGRMDDLAVALAHLDALSPIQKRRVLGSYMARVSPTPRRIVNGKRKESAA